MLQDHIPQYKTTVIFFIIRYSEKPEPVSLCQIVSGRDPLTIHLVRHNKSRVDYAAKFEKLIADHNTGAKDIDAFFVELVSFARSLSEEEQRGVSENLSEEELAIFDLLTRPNIKLTKKEK